MLKRLNQRPILRVLHPCSQPASQEHAVLGFAEVVIILPPSLIAADHGVSGCGKDARERECHSTDARPVHLHGTHT